MDLCLDFNRKGKFDMVNVEEFKSRFWEECLLYDLIEKYNYHDNNEYLTNAIKEIAYYTLIDDDYNISEEEILEWVESSPDIKGAIESYREKLVAYNDAWNNLRNF